MKQAHGCLIKNFSYRAMCTATKLMTDNEAMPWLIVISFYKRHLHGSRARVDKLISIEAHELLWNKLVIDCALILLEPLGQINGDRAQEIHRKWSWSTLMIRFN